MIKLLFPKYKHESIIDWIIWNMFLYWLVIDSLTGYFLNMGTVLPISQAYKFFLIVLLLTRIVKFGSGLLISAIFIYISVFFIHISIINEPISESLIHLSKILLTVLIYVYIYNCISRYSSNIILVRTKKILYVSFFIVASNILLGIIGVGFNTYPDEQIGYKGFFFAGNEIGGVLAVLIPFFLCRVFYLNSTIAYFLSCLFCLSISILLGTKAVILISIIAAFAIPWLYGNRQIKLCLIVLFIIALISAIPYLMSLIDSREIDLLVRLTHSYEKGGIASLVFSSRDEFWELKKTEFLNSDYMTQLLGLGGNRTVEMDQFDALLNYGYIGLILIYAFYMYIFLLSWIGRKNNAYSKVIVFSNLLLLGMSIIAGHIFFSSMAGMFISLNNNISRIKSYHLFNRNENISNYKYVSVKS